MNKKILCIGDSFTYGAGLTDPKINAWPSLLQKMNGWDVLNMGENGASNDRSIRVLFEEIDNEYHLIIMSWTVWARFEIFDCNKKIPISVAPGTYEHKKVLWAKDYYTFWYDDGFNLNKMINQIILVQSFLQNMRQPYIFTDVFGFHHNNIPSSLLDKIDKTKFLNWGNSLNEMIADFPKGPNGHPLIEGHQYIADQFISYIQQNYPDLCEGKQIIKS